MYRHPIAFSLGIATPSATNHAPVAIKAQARRRVYH